MDILQQVKDKLEEMKAKYNQERDEEEYPNHSDGNGMFWSGFFACLKEFSFFVDHLEVKEVDVSSISENLAEAYSCLDYTHTSNLAHNKPMVAARLRKAIRCLFDAGLFKLTHDEKYRMENLGLKAQKGE